VLETGVRLGDRKDHLGRARGQPGQPGLALLIRAELADHFGGDRGRYQEQQQRRALRGDLLADQGQLGQAASATAVLLRDVDPDEPGLASAAHSSAHGFRSAAWAM